MHWLGRGLFLQAQRPQHRPKPPFRARVSDCTFVCVVSVCRPIFLIRCLFSSDYSLCHVFLQAMQHRVSLVLALPVVAWPPPVFTRCRRCL